MLLTIEVYVVAGPTKTTLGGRQVPGGFDYLQRNLSLLAGKNPNIRFEVHIAHSVYHGETTALNSLPNMSICLRLFSNENFRGLSDLDPVVQHGALLNQLFISCKPSTNFILVIDPDCFAFQEHLLEALIEKMETKGLGAIGVPYPAWYPKEYTWRTPQVYFLLFDRRKIDPSKIDLRAGDQFTKLNSNSKLPEGIFLKVLRRLRSILLSVRAIKIDSLFELVMRIRIDIILRRYLINPKDTGWRISDYLDSNKIPYETMRYILRNRFDLLGFDELEYIKNNPDLRLIRTYSSWFFLRNGLIENRKIGKQGIAIRILNFTIRNRSFRPSDKWPASSLIGLDLVGNRNLVRVIISNLPYIDVYEFEGRGAIFHIGSKGKGLLQDELNRLDDILIRL